MGVGVVASLWSLRRDSKGILLFHRLAEIPKAVRSGFKVQIHIAEVDQFVSLEQRTLWVQSAQTAGLSVQDYTYRGAGHFFTDANSADYCAAASELTWARAIDFLERLLNPLQDSQRRGWPMPRRFPSLSLNHAPFSPIPLLG